MRKQLPPEMLARDARFVRTSIMDQIMDPRNQKIAERNTGSAKLEPGRPAAGDRARNLMHGIFTGEIQALEGAGRTTFDFDETEAPFALKLDMARQCWDEARHVEISIKLGDWMGTEIGEFSEATFLYEAACAPDPVLRLCGVNRALEGLAIDVFNTMKEFGDVSGDPVLEFCEDWMLADEVTHVKMGSDWLRRLTADDPERRERALEFQKTVDKLFSLGGFRGETDDNPIHLARKLRQMAGFTTTEIDEIADLAAQAQADAQAAVEAAGSA
ncbi:MAG: ferritin-like domain-containing protein [Actinobacteria bacterium]|nr:ferritin-like domain-containing protein [Actinomycetota bacterium]